LKSTLQKAFEEAADKNYWSDTDSLSGPGSNMEQTMIIRKAIPELMKKYGVKSMLDAPCGDLFWMKNILPELAQNNILYHGADIVSTIIEKHQITYKNYNVVFHSIDLIKGPVPKVDLIFTRDCFIHLSYRNIYSILRNYQLSGTRYLLTNTYTKPYRKNVNVEGFYLWGRMLNMEKFPFYFPKPIEIIVEGCTENEGVNADKSLGLWEINKLPLFTLRLISMLLLIPETMVSLYTEGIYFLKRIKNFVKRKVAG